MRSRDEGAEKGSGNEGNGATDATGDSERSGTGTGAEGTDVVGAGRFCGIEVAAPGAARAKRWLPFWAETREATKRVLALTLTRLAGEISVCGVANALITTAAARGIGVAALAAETLEVATFEAVGDAKTSP